MTLGIGYAQLVIDALTPSVPYLFLGFFFQAEDGIRDYKVTGVQTCALPISKLVGFLTDFGRVNHRMHNKLMVMDNAVAMVGGRNMGDPYFEVHPQFNFRDLDIAAAGPVVRDLSSVFDRFWNGHWSVPIAALVDRPYTEADLRGALRQLREQIAREPYPHPLDERSEVH